MYSIGDGGGRTVRGMDRYSDMIKDGKRFGLKNGNGVRVRIKVRY